MLTVHLVIFILQLCDLCTNKGVK